MSSGDLIALGALLVPFVVAVITGVWKLATQMSATYSLVQTIAKSIETVEVRLTQVERDIIYLNSRRANRA